MAVRMVEEALRAAFSSGWDVRGQLPVALDEESEPEPDVSVVPGSVPEYWIVDLMGHALEVCRDPIPDARPRPLTSGSAPRSSRGTGSRPAAS